VAKELAIRQSTAELLGAKHTAIDSLDPELADRQPRVRRKTKPEIIRDALISFHGSVTDYSVKVDIQKHPRTRLLALLKEAGIKADDSSFKRGLKLAKVSLAQQQRQIADQLASAGRSAN
jgi:hypothetical protein